MPLMLCSNALRTEAPAYVFLLLTHAWIERDAIGEVRACPLVAFISLLIN
jgi:hypothetical protein